MLITMFNITREYPQLPSVIRVPVCHSGYLSQHYSSDPDKVSHARNKFLLITITHNSTELFEKQETLPASRSETSDDWRVSVRSSPGFIQELCSVHSLNFCG